MLGYNRTGGSNAGSQVLIEALQSQGTVTTVSEPQILTVSNRMSNVNIGRDQGFAASSGKSVGGLSSVSQDQITPGILETGTNIFVFPTIDTETDEITVQLNTSFRDFNKFNTFESGQSRIQTPDTNKRKFDLTFVAKSGQTWLVTGYKSKRIESESSHSGFDIPFLDILLGGSKRSRDVYTETMLLITPRILGKK
jgi:type II secretory pathway component GspD/PulD (secretin)